VETRLLSLVSSPIPYAFPRLTFRSKFTLLVLEILCDDIMAATIIERAYMLKLDCTSTQIWEALGCECNKHLPKDVLHNLEFKFKCSSSDITKAAKWVASLGKEKVFTKMPYREMHVSSRALVLGMREMRLQNEKKVTSLTLYPYPLPFTLTLYPLPLHLPLPLL
jgi:hypothetical protein